MTFAQHMDSLPNLTKLAAPHPLAYRDIHGIICADCMLLGFAELPATPVYDPDDLVGERDTSDGFMTVATRYYLGCSSCMNALHPNDDRDDSR